MSPPPTVFKKLLVRDTNGKLLSVAVCNTDTVFNQLRAEITRLRLTLSRDPRPAHFRISLVGKVLNAEEERAKLAWDVIKELACEGFPEGLPLVLVPLPESSSVLADSRKRTGEHISSTESPSKKSRLEGECLPTECFSKNQYTSPSLEVYEPNLFDIGSNETVHVKVDRSHDQCVTLLEKARDFINQPQLHRFCSPAHRTEWNKEIDGLLGNLQEPETIIGCLGGTGVGKSSLLKALLNEDNILPTSSSRGCTAAVVELKFNREFVKPQGQLVVYKGEIEFISLQDWKQELHHLIGDCCGEDSKVSPHRMEENEDIAASWKKIDSVYGFGTMDSHDGKTKDQAYKILSEDPRVVGLLGSRSEGKCNLIEVTEGQVTASDSAKLLDVMRDPNITIDKKLARKKKRWVNEFRKKINSYVYRKGDGKEPQTWPLIRKVVLRGPWHVLSTGACLVDLPGVGDDNAARAKVAEKYLQKCTKIWIFAPIKRAVDDKLAKDLLGKEFKRRLLMDGNYSNVSFICTHSDDCEISEIMHDHEDVAREEPGRWEQMLALRETITSLAKTDDELEEEIEDIEDRLKSSSEKLQEISQLISAACSDETKVNEEILTIEVNSLSENLLALKKQVDEAPDLRSMKRMECHKKLKVLASRVRNEYSRKSLQADFRHGIEELIRKPSVEEMEELADSGEPSIATNLLPGAFTLDVFCTASNEYLKLQRVKTGSDGGAVCFSSPADTGIPAMVQSVFDTTEQFRAQHVISLIKKTGSILGRIYLYTSSKDEMDDEASKQYANTFELETTQLEPMASQIAHNFGFIMENIVRKDLEPSLLMAASRGDNESISVLDQWFSCEHRSRRAPKNKGLHWRTLGAACRRNGVYKSSSVGSVSLNQELLNPLEHEFCTSWRKVMVVELTNHLESARQELLTLCKNTLHSVSQGFTNIGLDINSAQWMETAGYQGCEALINDVIRNLCKQSTQQGRRLNRSTCGRIRRIMTMTYSSVAQVAGGAGKASRQMNAMKAGGKNSLTLENFTPMMTELHKDAVELIQDLADSLKKAPSLVRKSLEKVCFLNRLDREYGKAMKTDPRIFVEIFDSRNALLPNLVRLCIAHDNIMDYMDVSHEVTDRVTSNLPDGFMEAKDNLMGIISLL